MRHRLTFNRPVSSAASTLASAPSQYGNFAGEKIQQALSGVGGPLGSSLEAATKPVGNVVNSVVGGTMRAGEMAYSQTGLPKYVESEQKK